MIARESVNRKENFKESKYEGVKVKILKKNMHIYRVCKSQEDALNISSTFKSLVENQQKNAWKW